MRGSTGPPPLAAITDSVLGRFGGGGSAGVAAASRGWCRPILGTGRVPPATIELIRHARQELGYGWRARLWLQRLHGVRLAMGTIQRVFRDLGLPRLRRTHKREPRQMKLRFRST